EIRGKSGAWENLYRAAGSPDGIIVVECSREETRPLLGKTLSEIAKSRGRDPVETILDILLEDRSRLGSVYFLMSEENVSKQMKLPWVSFCSDSASMAVEEPFVKTSTHPRAYGSFVRVLGKYARDEKALSLGEALRRVSGLPASNLKLRDRGERREGGFADVVVFDPAVIADRATYKQPHQYAVGVREVFVNGVEVIRDGLHTGAKPGRALWGPGRRRE